MADKDFDPYAIMGVDKQTSDEDIKKAYKTLSKKLHPDAGGKAEDFANLKKAFDILTDPAKRNLYDEFGIDDSLDIAVEAKMVAAQIVISALDGLPDSCDIDKEITRIFQRCLAGLKEQENSAKTARDKLQRRLDGIQKKPVDDFITNEIIKVIETHNREMKRTQLNYRIHDTAFKLVQEYKFDISKIPFMGDTTNSSMSMRSSMQSMQSLYKNLGIYTGNGG
jgi:curved DNA-binding protein CbpA